MILCTPLSQWINTSHTSRDVTKSHPKKTLVGDSCPSPPNLVTSWWDPSQIYLHILTTIWSLGNSLIMKCILGFHYAIMPYYAPHTQNILLLSAILFHVFFLRLLHTGRRRRKATAASCLGARWQGFLGQHPGEHTEKGAIYYIII